MFISKQSRTSSTLLCYLALALALVSASQAVNLNPPQRDHVQLNRMIKKRVLLEAPSFPRALIPVIGAGNEPPTSSDLTGNSASASSAQPSVTPSASAPSVTPSTPSASESVPSASQPAVPSSDSASATPSSETPSSVSSVTPSSISSVVPSASSTPSVAPSSASEAPASAATPSASTGPSASKATRTATATVTDQASESASAVGASANNSPSKVTKTTLIVLVSVAASIGGIFVIWTIIRKWKFKPSSDFEDRMQPIDWQPTTADDNVPGLHRSATGLSHGSSGHGDSPRGYGSDHGHNNTLQPLPEHDFTAGPATLAPVGGYADLARGPSPGPQMTQRPYEYESYGVPLHHQNAYDYNSGARY